MKAIVKKRLNDEFRTEIITKSTDMLHGLGYGCDTEFLTNLTDKELLKWLKNISNLATETLKFNTELTDDSFNYIIDDIIARRAWDEIIQLFRIAPEHDGITIHWVHKAYIKCKDVIPKEQLWSFLMDIYVIDGYDFPPNLILEAIPYRPAEYLSALPNKYSDSDCVIVYRASTTTPMLIDKVSKELSWTINPSVAKSFYKRRKRLKQECYYYKAKILKNNIIAFISPNEQEEILQYGGVQNIMPMEDYEVDSLIEIQKRFGDAITPEEEQEKLSDFLKFCKEMGAIK